MKEIEYIRNFSIIAHVDHGKSTLADRILELTGAVPEGMVLEQYLDRMDIERERGITIKAQTVRLNYKSRDERDYVFNLIDTPGHVDFTYEVSRSLAACEGAILVVDASQGVEAQTIANLYLALELDLHIVPVINKIDLPSANPEKVKAEIVDLLGIHESEILLASAKKGIGIREILEAVVMKIAPPKGDPDAPLKAIIFDSWFNNYSGVITLVRVFEGCIRKGMKIMMMSSGKAFEVQKLGVFSPEPSEVQELSAGEVGFIIAGIKEVRDTKIGDTITELNRPTKVPFPGFKIIKPMVFCGLYPVEPAQYGPLRDALEKLRLNDSSFTYEYEVSQALGFGFRCGFLGSLHMDIIRERLEREFALKLIATAPTVLYRIIKKDGEILFIDNPNKIPDPASIIKIEEPYIRATIHTPLEYIGDIMRLCEERRGDHVEIKYLSPQRGVLIYDLPLSEVIFDFYDRLKSLSRGYSSMDYELLDYREGDLVKVDILINGERIDSLCFISPMEKAYTRGKAVVTRLREVIPRQLFEVVIQAAIGSRVIARESIKPLRKNVTAKCYGGDITRKRKLLEKQKEGKKRMKRLGKVEIPQEAFLAILKIRD